MAQKNTPKARQKNSKKVSFVTHFFARIRERSEAFLGRRPHRSFRMTKRRDYSRSLKLPGYWAFTIYVHKTLWTHKKIFISLTIVYALLTAFLVGIASQDTYTSLTDTLRETGAGLFEGNSGEITKAGLLFATAITGGLSQTLTELQQVYSVLIGLMAWLTTVWLLRNLLAGHKVTLRDGVYNSAAPLVPTFLVALCIIVQLLPLAIALIGYSAAVSSGLLEGGVEAMLFWIGAGLLAVLSLYWITSTFIALIIVTLPGMYPLRALRNAGDIVVGRRLRILLRLVWMAFVIAVLWAIILIPIILFDTWLKGVWPEISWVAIIPISLLLVGSATVIWAASYVYLLYRKVVQDDADPA